MIDLATSPPAASDSEADFEQAPYLHRGATWEQYLALDELFTGTQSRVRFLKKRLQIVSISPRHEKLKTLLSFLLEQFCAINEIEFFPTGSATLKHEGDAGGEPDESYCFHHEKERPDLVVEIALTSGGLSKRAFYKEFDVPEIWIWRNDHLEIHHLNEQGEYVHQSSSQLLPGLNIIALGSAMQESSSVQALRRFRELAGQ